MVERTLTMRITFPAGEGEVQGTDDHPLVAPYRRAMAQGAPTEPSVLNLFAVQPQDMPILLGSLVLTRGRFLLFFPGASLAVSTDDPRAEFEEGLLDHVTLNPPTGIHRRYSSHVALRDGPRPLKIRDRVPPGLRVPFFSLLIPSLEGFVRLPRLFTYTFAAPRPDVSDYAKDLAIEGGNLRIPIEEPANWDPSFLQLDVWVARDRREKGAGIMPLAWALKPGIVRNAPDPQTVNASRTDHFFTEDYSVALVISRPMGELLSPWILRPRLSQNAAALQ